MADSERIKAARRQYQREYRKKHPDKVKKWQENFWAKYGEKTKATGENGFLSAQTIETENKCDSAEKSIGE